MDVPLIPLTGRGSPAVAEGSCERAPVGSPALSASVFRFGSGCPAIHWVSVSGTGTWSDGDECAEC